MNLPNIWCLRALGFTGAVLIGAPAMAQTVPTIDTEDATLGSADVADKGRIHPVLSIDLRNGDFARGAYDDDAADLDRLPVHVQLGLAADLHRNRSGKADSWLIVRSSNGFHSASASETTSPRGWYESNNLVAVVVAPAEGLRTALVYTIKTSPNGVSDTTHEASASVSYSAKSGVGVLHPNLVATVRPKGNHGVFVQAGIEPELPLTDAEDAPSLSLPLAIGVGFGGFYDAGSGDRVYGSAGVAFEQPFAMGDTHWKLRAEMLALIRDDRLRRLSADDRTEGTVVPLATIGLTLAY